MIDDPKICLNCPFDDCIDDCPFMKSNSEIDTDKYINMSDGITLSDYKRRIKHKPEKLTKDQKKYDREYRKRNKERIKVLTKIYYLNHKEIIKEYKKQYWINNKERLKEQQKEYREQKKKLRIQRWIDHREKVMQQQGLKNLGGCITCKTMRIKET